MKLKAAVKRHLELFQQEGSTEEQVREAIANDPKGFDDEGIDEVYNALFNYSPDEEEREEGHTVIVEFRDINNYDVLYEVGDNVDHLPSERLQDLISKKLVELV